MIHLTTVAPTFMALAFLAMGLGAFVRPDLVLAQFGVRALGRDGRGEVRAVYGGFGIAMAAVLLASLLVPAWHAPVCLTVATALAGMAGGRLVLAMVDRGIGRVALVYLLVEITGAGLLVSGATSS